MKSSRLNWVFGIVFLASSAFGQDPTLDRLKQTLVDLESAVRSDGKAVEARVRDVEQALQALRHRTSGDNAALLLRVEALEKAWGVLRSRVQALESGTESDRRAITDLRNQVATLSKPAMPSLGRRVVVPMGSVMRGEIVGDDVVIGMGSAIQGGITARRLWVEDGAVIQGAVRCDELYAASSVVFSSKPVRLTAATGTYVPPPPAAPTADRYLAIAYAPGPYAPPSWRAWDHPDVESAKRTALTHCGLPGCQIATWAKNACAALAISKSDRAIWGADWDEERTGRANAERRALERCQARPGNPLCVIETSVCPGDKVS